MISIIIPAHNEASVIQRSLQSLTQGSTSGELEVIVVCNGCSDNTAQLARDFGPPVRVLETTTPSKSFALNMGDEAATGFPRIYSDADVILSLKSVRKIAEGLEAPGILAAAPAVDTVFPEEASWAVRAYYRFWMALPYVQEGMMAAGVYAVNRQGRQRFDQFPGIINDDGYVRLQFTANERVEVKSALSVVSAPARFWDLVLIKTRSRLGLYQLKKEYPELFAREAHSKGYGSALWAILKRPALWPCAVPYLWVNFISRRRARMQLEKVGSGKKYVWERDNSSRSAKSVGSLPPESVEAAPRTP